jgi:hypothetical protein
MKKETLIKKFTLVKEPDMHILKVEKKDYAIIEFDKANRKFGKDSKDKGRHSAELGEKMRVFKILGIGAACIENGKIVVADGQHRTHDRMSKGLPVYFFLSEESFEDTVVCLNTTAKNLSKLDFIHLIATKGNKDFQKLERIFDEAAKVKKESKGKLEIVQALLISIFSQTKRTEAAKIVKDKTFKVINETKGKKIVEQIYDLQRNGLKTGLRQSEGLVNLIIERGSDYNHSLMIKRFKASDLQNEINSIDKVKTITSLLSDIHDNTTKGMPNLKKAA